MTDSGEEKKVIRGQDLFCPRDGNGMEEKLMGEALLDVCGKCGGQFFDLGEMFAAFGLKADPSYWDRPETGGTVRDGNFSCPRCKMPMLAQDVTHGGDHVEIDRCRGCNGIWLDGGEVQAIMRISGSMVPVVDEERSKAKDDLAKGLQDMRPTGLIGAFLKLFTTTTK